MKVELKPFQIKAVKSLLMFADISKKVYAGNSIPQIISFTAPTGAGKTIMTAAFVEKIYEKHSDTIFIWLSDSPELNKQSLDKFYYNADGINHSQLVTIEDRTFKQKILDDGKIYFLNTQKLGKSSNLTKPSDLRQCTIWETLQNTIEIKSDKLYFIIDEAHRGMKTGRATATATTIMQKFIKGSVEDKLSPAPLVIGMSATPERFNALVKETSSTIHKVIVTTEEVRNSGLLKEKIFVVYPEETEKNFAKDMALLEAAADEWKDKCEHWARYCREHKEKFFNPIFVVQVLNGTGKNISDTDLDECLKRISARTGYKFEVGEVVHTFGQTETELTINNLRVFYEEPSHISGNDKVKVVFFKENLSTGWDCPQAETMMSFRRATDATYIAQLLGRMIRTPLQRRIDVDDTLNEVHLYLPHFDKETARNVVDELQKTEGGVISSEIISESAGEKTFVTLTTKIDKPAEKISNVEPARDYEKDFEENFLVKPEKNSAVKFVPTPTVEENYFNREEIVKAINQMGLTTYRLNGRRINDYLKSLLNLANFLTRNFIAPDAQENIFKEIVNMIHSHIESLKQNNLYDELSRQVKEFRLSAQIFDAFGKSFESVVSQNLFVTTNTDIDRQFLQAEAKLKSEGITNFYLKTFGYDEDNKVDLIIFAADNDCLNRLEKFSKKHFHELQDKYRFKVAKCPKKIQTEYDKIISAGDNITEHNFILPETITVPHDIDGKIYHNHLFVDKRTGTACIKLNGWEEGVLAEEQLRADFVCWIRNLLGKNSLCIKYKSEDNEFHLMYPDFLIIRRVDEEYFLDILEPHDSGRRDNLGKAQGLAEYAKKNKNVSRIQLIREVNAARRKYFSRLDLSKSEICEKVLHASSNNELDKIFGEYQ